MGPKKSGVDWSWKQFGKRSAKEKFHIIAEEWLPRSILLNVVHTAPGDTLTLYQVTSGIGRL